MSVASVYTSMNCTTPVQHVNTHEQICVTSLFAVLLTGSEPRFDVPAHAEVACTAKAASRWDDSLGKQVRKQH